MTGTFQRAPRQTTEMRKRQHRPARSHSSHRASTETEFIELEHESLDARRDELLATLHELYARASEVARRVLEDMQILEGLHGDTSELLYKLRSLPAAPPRAVLAEDPAPSRSTQNGPRLPRLLPFREVAQRVALSRSTIWRMERAGQFPPRRRVSVNKVAWWEPEVEEWLRNRARL